MGYFGALSPFAPWSTAGESNWEEAQAAAWCLYIKTKCAGSRLVLFLAWNPEEMTETLLLSKIPFIYPHKKYGFPSGPGAIVFLFTFSFVIKYPCYSPKALLASSLDEIRNL